MSFVDAVEELAALAGMNVPRDADPAHPVTDLYDVMQRAADLYRRELKQQRRRAGLRARARPRRRDRRGIRHRLRARGVGHDARVRSAPIATRSSICSRRASSSSARRTTARQRQYDRFRNRLMFPIRDARGRVIAFGGRVLGKAGEHEPKYLNSPETPLFHKGRELYGVYELRKALRDVSARARRRRLHGRRRARAARHPLRLRDARHGDDDRAPEAPVAARRRGRVLLRRRPRRPRRRLARARERAARAPGRAAAQVPVPAGRPRSGQPRPCGRRRGVRGATAGGAAAVGVLRPAARRGDGR